jgi:UDP-glucose:(heptosyl)LPS alpha-1,3-glucosyltransferase
MGGSKRVAVVIPKYGRIGGAERFAFELTERLARDGRYEMHVFANRWVAGPGPVTFHKVPKVRFPRFLRQVGFAWFVGRAVESGGFDLVHSHDRIFSADVFTMHSIPHETWVRDVRRRRPSLFDRAMAWIERRLVERGGCARFLPVSGIAGDAYRSMYGFDASRVRVLHPGVDLARFTSPDRAACRAAVRELYGIGPSEIVALFVGMNFEVKGLGAIIEAVAKAKVQRPGADLRLLVVGKGDPSEYRSLATSMGIGDTVIFAGPQEGVEEFYLASDLFLLLSRFDTFGMVVLEAMAARLPVILSATVGAKDLVEEGVNGFVLPDGRDADAAAGKIVLLLDAGRRAALGEAGFRTASAHSWERLAGAVGKVYEEAIAERGPAFRGTVA